MIAGSSIPTADTRKKPVSVKCIAWDLDNTLWDGILLEDPHVTVRPEVVAVIKELDSRGILHSIASRNDHDTAMAKLRELGLCDYFLYPQINWNPKSESVKQIAQAINIGIDTIAFVDDQPFEREEVAFELPEVLCIDAAAIAAIPTMPEMMPRFITQDSRLRRQMYLSDIERKQAEDGFAGPSDEFLATLSMVFTIAPAQESDLQRAEELTVRTNQLNTTGYTYSYEELRAFCQSPRHKLLIAALDDKYGPYGKIGLSLIECEPDIWTIKLLLMSCRVMSRGVGTIMINHIMHMAQRAGVRLRAEFISNNRNRMMYITYKFGGFREVEKIDDLIVFENDLSHIQPFPSYVQVDITEFSSQ
jgi:FkbH-like protein